MRHMSRLIAVAAAAVSLTGGLTAPASAAPGWVAPGPAGMCPPGYHLGAYGHWCHRDGWRGRPCPPGWHLGVYGRRCHRN
jgi:hypothetical protein